MAKPLKQVKKLQLPLAESAPADLAVGDMIEISGRILTGRDAVLPQLVKLAEDGRLAEFGIDLRGAVIFHTAVSPAGVGPTSSNKREIEGAIPALSKAGVKLHLGKGRLSPETIAALAKYNSIYAVVPPVTALLESKIVSRRVVAFPEQGMEALHELEVKDFPCIVAAAHGKCIY